MHLELKTELGNRQCKFRNALCGDVMQICANRLCHWGCCRFWVVIHCVTIRLEISDGHHEQNVS